MSESAPMPKTGAEMRVCRKVKGWIECVRVHACVYGKGEGRRGKEREGQGKSAVREKGRRKRGLQGGSVW